MTGDPRHFESIGSRLGFRAEPSADGELNLVWRGGRFPALLCLGIAAFLLLLNNNPAHAFADYQAMTRSTDLASRKNGLGSFSRLPWTSRWKRGQRSLV